MGKAPEVTLNGVESFRVGNFGASLGYSSDGGGVIFVVARDLNLRRESFHYYSFDAVDDPHVVVDPDHDDDDDNVVVGDEVSVVSDAALEILLEDPSYYWEASCCTFQPIDCDVVASLVVEEDHQSVIEALKAVLDEVLQFLKGVEASLQVSLSSNHSLLGEMSVVVVVVDVPV